MTDNQGYVTYRVLELTELVPSVMADFDRYQEVTKCWRFVDGEFVIRDVVFTEQWRDREKSGFIDDLVGIVRRGGMVFAAEKNGKFVGFASIDSEPFGSRGQYIELASIHVSAECRGLGIGKALFKMACDEARERGAEKLYISAHSSVESQAFYRHCGCVLAEEINRRLAELEPCDIQLEKAL